MAWRKASTFWTAALFAAACSSTPEDDGGDDSNDGTGGTGAPAGGSAGIPNGGVSGTSGTPGTGGDIGPGGTAGTTAGTGTTGGTTSSGGTGTTGGTTSTGGTTAGTGTTGGAGGSTGGGAGMAGGVKNGFDTTLENWKVEYTAAGGASAVIDKGTVMLTWTGADGDPSPGALEGSIPYTAASQYVGFGINYDTPVNLTGATITLHVKLVSGLGEAVDLMTNPGGAKIYAKSGTAYCYANGPYNNLTMAGAWMTISFDIATPDYVDMACATPFSAADIREIGVQFDTGGMTTTATAAVVHIDTLAY